MNKRTLIFFLLILATMPAAAVNAQPATYKVLVVMSYENSYPWTNEIKNGIEFILGNSCNIKYFYLNTKFDFDHGPDLAAEAFALTEDWNPDGIIAADDDAQSMFVAPYLLNKSDIPVVFCGVNADPAQYGYPGNNVSGVCEKHHIAESIALAQQLVDDLKTVCFISRKNPTNIAVFENIRQEAHAYTARSITYSHPETLDQALTSVEQMRDYCDLLFLENLRGLSDDTGTPLTDDVIMPQLITLFGKPTIGANNEAIRYGVLCAVTKAGEEQGYLAAKMLLEAMNGKNISDIPFEVNQMGKRVINVTEMKRLGIVPRPEVLRGAELIRTE